MLHDAALARAPLFALAAKLHSKAQEKPEAGLDLLVSLHTRMPRANAAGKVRAGDIQLVIAPSSPLGLMDKASDF